MLRFVGGCGDSGFELREERRRCFRFQFGEALPGLDQGLMLCTDGQREQRPSGAGEEVGQELGRFHVRRRSNRMQNEVRKYAVGFASVEKGKALLERFHLFRKAEKIL